MKFFKTIIIGSGFSAFILNQILKQKHQIITTDSKYIKCLTKRKILTKHLKLFVKKYNSYGIYEYVLKNLHYMRLCYMVGIQIFGEEFAIYQEF